MFLTDTHFTTKPLAATAAEIAASVHMIPSAPTVLPNLYHRLRSGDATLQQVESLIRLDPGLTARVLEMGNVLHADKGGACITVEEAINCVGFDAIDAMVATVADEQVFVRPVNFYGLDADEFWRLSVSCALAAELIATRTGDDPNLAYTAGLLHAVGMVAVDDFVMRKEPALMLAGRPFPCEYTHAERAMFGFTHAEVGAQMLKRWGFQPAIVDSVRSQYAPYSSAGYARMSCLLYVAKWLRSVVCQDEDVAPPAMPARVILQPLRLTPEDLAKLVVEVRLRLGYVRNSVWQIAA